MGLSAVVFKSASRLKNEYSREFEVVDEETGEAAAVDDPDFLSLDQSAAASARLGNVAEVAFLRAAVISVVGEGSFIAESVLHSGTHSGDCIPSSRLHLLRDELGRLQVDMKANESGLARFISAMQALIDVAEKERNPIVFV